MTWRDIADDPNAPTILEGRQQVLEQAACEPLRGRETRIVGLCAGRRVLDIGCLDHHIGASAAPTWLHRRIVEVASSCVGVDLEPDGVRELIAAGYDTVEHDICAGVGPLASRPRFDVVVAGELVEHLAAPQALFDFAASVLNPAGLLVITTPNPYAPHRVRSGQLGLAWENADHVIYSFPAGIVELGERTGFVLEEYRTVSPRRYGQELRRLTDLMFTRLSGRRWGGRRYDGAVARLPGLGMYVNPVTFLWLSVTRSRRFLGETALYVLRKVA